MIQCNLCLGKERIIETVEAQVHDSCRHLNKLCYSLKIHCDKLELQMCLYNRVITEKERNRNFGNLFFFWGKIYCICIFKNNFNILGIIIWSKNFGVCLNCFWLCVTTLLHYIWKFLHVDVLLVLSIWFHWTLFSSWRQ